MAKPEPLIDLRPDHLAIVQDILREHLQGVEVWAYGSRAAWTDEEYSDLDLVARNHPDPLQPLDFTGIEDAREAFMLSNLPFRVELFDWARLPVKFHGEIEKGYVVVQGREKQAGGLPEGWRETRLGDCIKVQGGFAFKSSDFCKNGIPVIKIRNVRSRYIDIEDIDFVSSEVAESVKNYFLCNGDTVISMTGSGPNVPNSVVGRVAKYIGGENKLLINQRVGRFLIKDNTKVAKEFLFYILSQPAVQNHLAANSTGSANQANISNQQIEDLVFSLPPLPEQKAIAAILGALDDKIEANRKMNATLEGIARALFKSWFVDFDPVRAKAEGRPSGLPADLDALFPASFTDSPLGEIPMGWEVKSLGDIVQPKKGKSITKKTVTDGTIPVVAGGLEPAYFHNQSNSKAPTITISASGANAGFVRLYNIDVWASDCSIINKTITPFIYSVYVFLKINQREIYNMQQGAAQPHIYPSDIMRLGIVNPPYEIWETLEKIISPLFENIGNNDLQNQTLATLRDTLLPKLISGQIRVGDVGKLVETIK